MRTRCACSCVSLNPWLCCATLCHAVLHLSLLVCFSGAGLPCGGLHGSVLRRPALTTTLIGLTWEVGRHQEHPELRGKARRRTVSPVPSPAVKPEEGAAAAGPADPFAGVWAGGIGPTEALRDPDRLLLSAALACRRAEAQCLFVVIGACSVQA